MLTRRTLLRGAAAALPLSFLWRRRARAAGYGALVDDPEGLLQLPEGFSYRIIDRRGDVMSDGYLVPGAPDGMACFAGPPGSNTLILMRNHEIGAGHGSWSPMGPGMPMPEHVYDPESGGGVTRVVLDATTLQPISSNLVLYGTMKNCGGGVSPWGWLTCEEDTTAGHGYVFLCPTTADSVQEPQRIPAYGRMMHEGAVIEPGTLIAYITEDRSDSCLYRFVPDAPDTPWQGRLQALRVLAGDGFDTSVGRSVGDSWEIDWVDIDDPDPADDSCRDQGLARGAATFRRGEGIWRHDGSVYFTATSGGPLGAGQVFRLDPAGDGGTLTLIAQSDDLAVLDGPDAITVSPAGDVFICEDGEGEHHIRMIGADGAVADFARKLPFEGEMTGICFSPDGSTMFVNFQLECITVAITGPFPTVDPVDPYDPDFPPPGGPGTDHDPSGDAGYTAGCSAGSGAGLATAAAVVVSAAALSKS